MVGVGMNQSSIYRLLRLFNTSKAVGKSASSGSPAPVVRRIGRVAYGKGAGRLAGKLFR